MKSGRTDLLVTFLPIYTAWVAYFSGKKKTGYHHAFTFNFTELPTGWRLGFMRRQFEKIDRFTVYSQYEKELYSQVFRIPGEKIDVVYWGVGTPTVVEMDRVVEGDYVCAIGGEARDFGPFAEMAKALPQVQFVLVAQPKNLKGIQFPPNVRIFTNIPLAQVNDILVHALFSVVPLNSADSPCGLVTIVAGMHLGKAQVVTRSRGAVEYIEDGVTGLVANVGDPKDLQDKVERLLNDRKLCGEISARGLEFARTKCNEALIVAYFDKVLEEVASRN